MTVSFFPGSYLNGQDQVAYSVAKAADDRPATGEVRAKGVQGAPNAVLHPWLQGELTQVLATLDAQS